MNEPKEPSLPTVLGLLAELEQGRDEGRPWTTYGPASAPAVGALLRCGYAVEAEAETRKNMRSIQITERGLSLLFLDRAMQFSKAADALGALRASTSDPMVRARLEEHREDLTEMSAKWAASVTTPKTGVVR